MERTRTSVNTAFFFAEDARMQVDMFVLRDDTVAFSIRELSGPDVTFFCTPAQYLAIVQALSQKAQGHLIQQVV